MNKGMQFLHGATPEAVKRDADGAITAVATSQGEVPADLVVLAAGVRPETSLAESAGLEVNRGILTDEMLRTSDPDVFAAGDCTEARDMLTGQRQVLPIWPKAYSQGRCAGRNMAGAEQPHPGGLPMNSISYYGLPTISVGVVTPPEGEGYEVERALDEDSGSYRKLVFKEGKLAGFVLIGDIEKAGLFTSFVKFGFPVSADVRERLKGGEPSVLLWPEEFFEETWNPRPVNPPSA
jgi:NAD(P)H-nitrite reductase large subunit